MTSPAAAAEADPVALAAGAWEGPAVWADPDQGTDSVEKNQALTVACKMDCDSLLIPEIS